MPTYEYRCATCATEYTEHLPIKDLLLPTTCPCPECGKLTIEKVMLTAPSLGDSVRLGIRRVDNGFKEVLQKVHAANPRSTIADTSRYY
jgi:putative FmdB family regulatory protein